MLERDRLSSMFSEVKLITLVHSIKYIVIETEGYSHVEITGQRLPAGDPPSTSA